MKWTKEWPIEKGSYWFYGWRFGKTFLGKPELCFVEVHISANKIPMYITRGHMMYKEEGAEGLWTEAELPRLPKL